MNIIGFMKASHVNRFLQRCNFLLNYEYQCDGETAWFSLRNVWMGIQFASNTLLSLHQQVTG